MRDEATVKRLRLRDGQVVLQPENPAFAPLVFALAGAFAGVVVAYLLLQLQMRS